MYATTKPALIHWGVPTEQNNNCANYTRATTALMGITGNLDVPGGKRPVRQPAHPDRG